MTNYCGLKRAERNVFIRNDLRMGARWFSVRLEGWGVLLETNKTIFNTSKCFTFFFFLFKIKKFMSLVVFFMHKVKRRPKFVFVYVKILIFCLVLHHSHWKLHFRCYVLFNIGHSRPLSVYNLSLWCWYHIAELQDLKGESSLQDFVFFPSDRGIISK